MIWDAISLGVAGLLVTMLVWAIIFIRSIYNETDDTFKEHK